MTLFKRAWLFARDYIRESACAWSLARMHDCERNGGHRWAQVHSCFGIWAAGTEWECKRCGCSHVMPVTTTTASSNGITITYK